MYSNERDMNKRLYILLILLVSVLCCSIVLFASESKLKNADEYLRRKDYQQARQIYKEVFLSSKDPHVSEKSLWGIVECDYRLKHYFEVRLNIKRLFSTYPLTEHLNNAYLILGYMSLDLNELREATEYFKRVTGTLTDKALIGKAELALKVGDYLKAETDLAGIPKRLFDYDSRALFVRAMIYSRKGMHKDALSAVSRIYEADLKGEGLRIAKAQVYINAGKLKEAEAQLDGIVAAPMSRSEGIEAKTALFDVYNGQGRVDDALKIGQGLITYDAPDDLKMKVISFFEKKGDVENAIRYLVYLNDKVKRNSEIEKMLRKAISADDPGAVGFIRKYTLYLGSDSPFVVDAARYLLEKGNKKEADMFLRSASRGKAKGDADLFRAELYMEEGKYESAAGILDTLVGDKKYEARALGMLAKIMIEKGDYAAAIRELKKLPKTAETSSAIHEFGDLYWKVGDRKTALRYYIAAADKGDGASAVKAGDVYFLAGDRKKAAFYYQKAISSPSPDNATLQWAWYQAGKLTDNKAFLKKAAGAGGDIAEAAGIMLGGR